MLGFLRDESGAVTVDWVVLAASTVGIGTASVVAVGSGQNSLGAEIRARLEGAMVAGNPLYTSSFGEVGSMRSRQWTIGGVGTFDGWVALGEMARFEIMDDVYARVVNPSGNNMLDMGGSPGNLSMGRTLEGIRPGETHRISFTAADWVGNNQVDVFFGGVHLGTVNAGESMSNYSFDFVGGSGDGSNMLVLSETGNSDNVGTYIGDITIR